MWKKDQFGLAFMPELNRLDGDNRKEPDTTVLDMQAEYGCGRASHWQLPFIVMYMLYASASVCDLGLLVFIGAANSWLWESDRIIGCLVNFFLSHGIIVLASVVHHIPSKKPHNFLLVYMRVVTFFATIHAWLHLINEMHDYAGVLNNGDQRLCPTMSPSVDDKASMHQVLLAKPSRFYR